MFFRSLFSLLALSSCSLSAEVLSIAHRGDSLFAPENSISAFRSALGKSDWVESDIRVTSDGQLVVMHDATVDRTTDGAGAISGKTLAQLQLLDAGSWFSTNFIGERIPTFEEMITNILPSAIPLIEHKSGPAPAYVAELRRLNVVTNVVVQSFDWNFLSAVHALEPAIELCALGSGTLNSATLNSITNTGARTVAWEKSSITSNHVALVHDAGLKLFVWTVDGIEIKNFIDLGVDGIISNDPGRVRKMQEPPTNAPVNLAPDLIAYWKMDDGLSNAFATVVSDRAGTNAATLVRTDGLSHWFGSGTAQFDGCVQVDGANAFVTIPQTETLDINTNALTLSMWVRLEKLPSQLPASFGAIFDSPTDCYVFYMDKANKELRFKVTDENGHAARPGIPESLLTTNQWIHIAGTFSGSVGPASGEATIYLNGQPRDVHTGNDGSSPFGLTANVKSGQVAAIGREGPTGGSYFSGFVDDVAIWKRALGPHEIRNLFQAGKSLQAILEQPTPAIEIIGVRQNIPSNALELDFKNSGPWQTFRLTRAAGLNESFSVVSNLVPTQLGNGNYRFTLPINANASGFFRVQGQ